MTDQLFPEPLKVRFPCPHGQWFRHPVDTKPPKWEWCDGGPTKWLVLVDENPYAGDVYQDVTREVSDE